MLSTSGSAFPDRGSPRYARIPVLGARLRPSMAADALGEPQSGNALRVKWHNHLRGHSHQWRHCGTTNLARAAHAPTAHRWPGVHPKRQRIPVVLCAAKPQSQHCRIGCHSIRSDRQTEFSEQSLGRFVSGTQDFYHGTTGCDNRCRRFCSECVQRLPGLNMATKVVASLY